MGWDTIIQEKTGELVRFLSSRTWKLDVSEPNPMLEKTDSLDMRRCILSLTQREAAELGIGKSALHYLRKIAKSNRQFRIYKSTLKRMASIEVRATLRERL